MRCLSWTLALVSVLAAPAARAAPPAQGQSTAALAPAEAELARGAPAHAAAIARAVLLGAPDDPRALKILGTASCLLRDPVAARAAARRLPEVDRMLLADLCARRGVVLLDAHRPHPVLTSAKASRLYAEGVLQLSRGNPAAAERLLLRAHRIEPAPQILFEVVRCQVRAGQLRRAVATHRRYVRAFRDPQQRLAAAARFGELL